MNVHMSEWEKQDSLQQRKRNSSQFGLSIYFEVIRYLIPIRT